MSDAPKVQVACVRCTQGVMDSTNPHLLGTCGCACHGPAWKHSIYCAWREGKACNCYEPVDP